MITFDQFSNRIRILRGGEGQNLRRRYLAVFVDQASEYFKVRIAPESYDDAGVFYEGYLWDTLKSPEVIDWQQFEAGLRACNPVFVMWDLHSPDRILIDNYFKFGRDVIIAADSETILTGLRYLPEDLYVFDEQFRWSLIATHEYVDGSGRWCLRQKSHAAE